MYIHFDDLYTKANSPAISFDPLIPDNNSDATVLLGIRELAARRNQSVGREKCCKSDADHDIEKHIEMFERYLSLLHQFIVAANTKHWSMKTSTGCFQWSSPVSCLPSSSHASLPHVLLEFTMSLCFYAAALQENAWKILQKTTKTEEESEADCAANLTAAAALLRKSAGVYTYIRNNVLPEIETKEALPAVKNTPFLPLEVDGTAVEVLEAMALAAAQGIAAERAERKGASLTAIAAVHRGAVDLYEGASAILKVAVDTPGTPAPSERVRIWLALSAEIHAIKALRAQAGICKDDGELGQAVACLKDAILRVQRCLNVIATAKNESAGWRAPFLVELQRLESVHAVYDKERSVVYVQAIASVVPPPLEGKIIVGPAVVDWLNAVKTEYYFI